MLGRWYGDFTVRRLSVATGALLAKLGRSGREGSGRQPFELAEVTDVAWGFGALFISDGGDGDGLNERVARLDGATYEPVWIRGNNGTVDPSDDPVGNFSQLHASDALTCGFSLAVRDARWLYVTKTSARFGTNG